VRIHVEHSAPGATTPIVADPDGAPAAIVIDGNPLAPGWTLAEAMPPAAHAVPLIIDSGTLSETPLAAHPPTWMAPGRAALDRVWSDLAPRARSAGVEIWFRPNCRHVLSDPPSCLKFLGDHADDPVGIALAPAALFENAMLPTVEDHLERIFAILGPRCRMLFLEDLVAGEADAPCRAVGLGQGCLPRDLLASLVAAHVPETTPVVLRGDAIDEQRAWLTGGGAVAVGT